MQHLNSFRGRTPTDAQMRRRTLDQKLRAGSITAEEHSHFMRLEAANAAIESELGGARLQRKTSTLLSIPSMLSRTASFRGSAAPERQSVEEAKLKRREEGRALGRKLLADVDARIEQKGGKPMQLVTQVYRERSGSRISVTRKFSGRVWKPVFFMLRADRMGLYKDVRKLE